MKRLSVLLVILRSTYGRQPPYSRSRCMSSSCIPRSVPSDQICVRSIGVTLLYPAWGSINAIESRGSADDTQVWLLDKPGQADASGRLAKLFIGSKIVGVAVDIHLNAAVAGVLALLCHLQPDRNPSLDSLQMVRTSDCFSLQPAV